MKSLRIVVLSLFFLSGATALVYETAWARSLTLIFGATHEAVSIVLGAFMAGLALGGLLMGRLVGRIRRPLAVYGALELAIAVLALCVPTALAVVDRIYVAAALESVGVPGSLQLLRIVLGSSVLLVPTVLMGGTLPLLARLLIQNLREFGEKLSWLYAVNTAGAVAGTVSAGFVLLPRLGVSSTVRAAVLVNFAIGLVALVVDRLANLEGAGSVRRGESIDTETVEEWGGGTKALHWAFVGTAVSGMCALALEVLWMRGLTIAVGNTAYSFTVMLAAFLVGIAGGSWAHARFPLRRVSVPAQFGAILVLVGVASALFSQLVPNLPRLAVHLNRTLYADPSGIRAGATLLMSFAVMLIPCLLFGAAFPLAGEAGAKLRRDFGRSVGDLAALNTVGAIAGALLAGFVLIPALGLQRGMLVTAAVLAIYGLVVLGLVVEELAILNKWVSRSAVLALALSCLLAAFRLPAWDLHLLSVFRNNMLASYMQSGESGTLDRLAKDSQVLYHAEGRGSTVSVVEGPRARALVIDGKTVATDGLSDMQHELLLGHVPVLVHPAPRTAAVIGLGAGITLGAVLAHPELNEVRVVELEPAVVDGARLFPHVNYRALDDPRLQIIHQDGRNYLLTTRRKFDVITADPIHPWARGAAYLYTREYYELARNRLDHGGVMCQWLPLYELSLENVKSAIASFADVFPHTTVWQTTHDAILIGSGSPFAIDLEALRLRLANPTVGRQLSQIGLDDPLSFLAELALDRAGVDALTGDVIRNTDDNLYLEFSSPRRVARTEIDRIIEEFDKHRAEFSGLVTGGEDDSSTLASASAAFRKAKMATIEAHMELQRADAGRDPEAYLPLIDRLEGIVDRLPGYGRARSILSESYVGRGVYHYLAGRNEPAIVALRRAVEIMPKNAGANLNLATVLSESGALEEALPFFAAAVKQRSFFSTAHLNYGVTLLRLGRNAEAVLELERAVDTRPGGAAAHHMLATALAAVDRLAESVAEFQRALSLDADQPGVHANFARALIKARRYREAGLILDVGMQRWSEDPGLALQRAWLLAVAPAEEDRDAARAGRIAQAAAVALGGETAEILDIAAAAAAAEGNFEEATRLAERARTLASTRGQANLALGINERLELYRVGRAFRLPG